VRRMGNVKGLELRGRDIAQGFVQAVVVEPGDVLDDGQLKLRPRPPGAVGDQLGLEGEADRLAGGLIALLYFIEQICSQSWSRT
jgi:hypothetical protein